MHPDEPLRICRKCKPEHAENCPNCFGFGRWGDGTIVSAGEAAAKRHSEHWQQLDQPWRRCPVCGGTPYGRKLLPADAGLEKEP